MESAKHAQLGNKGSDPAGMATENAFSPATADQMHFRHPQTPRLDFVAHTATNSSLDREGRPRGAGRHPLGAAVFRGRRVTRLTPINPLVECTWSTLMRTGVGAGRLPRSRTGHQG